MEEKKDKVTRVDVIRKAREIYLKGMKRGLVEGICHPLHYAIYYIYGLPKKECGRFMWEGQRVQVYIPKFAPPKGTNWFKYWWPIGDYDSRLAFLDYLENEYKDDGTDLREVGESELMDLPGGGTIIKQ